MNAIIPRSSLLRDEAVSSIQGALTASLKRVRSSHRHISGITPQPFPDMPPTQHPASSSRPLCDRHRGRKCIASTPSLSPAPHSLTAFPRLPSGSALSLRQRTSGRLRCSRSTGETLTGPDSVRPREESGTLILIRDCARQSRPQTLIRGGSGPRSAYRTQDCPRHSRVQTCRNGIGPLSQRFNTIPPMYNLADYPIDCRY